MRIAPPLKEQRREPNRSVQLLTPTGLRKVPEAAATSEVLGQKALGLLTLPQVWTLPFFVVDSEVAEAAESAVELQKSLVEAAEAAGLDTERVIVRSNAISESLSDRGSLHSQQTEVSRVGQTLLDLHAKTRDGNLGKIHWIVQASATSYAQGQLSNERRVSRENRDWILEVEQSMPHANAQPIGVRPWRDGKVLEIRPLACTSSLQISVALRHVAHWGTRNGRRFLFEWVWDGVRVWLVQMDHAYLPGGINPHSVLPSAITNANPADLKRFRVASKNDFVNLRKLANARTYSLLGYEMPPFYVLGPEDGVRGFLESGELPKDLFCDLQKLTGRSLVLRTDGSTLPQEKREMLPRSQELRSVKDVEAWLKEEFRPRCIELGLANEPLSLIGHHFIPSASAAWARAEPGKRWVRIEALWGIPEGVYWHSHDTFEVDVDTGEFSKPFTGIEHPHQSHLRYKGTFIAPDAQGAWVYHQTDESSDWKPSITKSRWLSEIAYVTRQIAERVKLPVEVMWFVDTHKGASHHRVLPWYHSERGSLEVPVGTPRRRKLRSSQDVTIRTRHDWEKFKQLAQAGQTIERVLVEPRDSWLVRNLNFVEELGTMSANNDIVVVLSGGILSHAYHVLTRKGAHVECVDLFGASEETVEYNKLVRDKVPEHIASRGERYETVKLSGEALVTALRRKLVEEAFEALDANNGTDLLGELADLQEVVLAITTAVGLTATDLDAERLRKVKKRGGFNEGLMLQTTSSPRSLPLSKSIGTLVPPSTDTSIRTIVDPDEIPLRARYRRSDRRVVGNSAEDFVIVELELNRLEKETEAVSYKPSDVLDGKDFIVEAELKRLGADLRFVLKVRKRTDEIVAEQGRLSFGE